MTSSVLNPGKMTSESLILSKTTFEAFSMFMTIWGFCLLVSLGYFSRGAPYGRYGQKGIGPLVNAKLAWFLQELPSFIVPIILMYKTTDFRALDTPKLLLTGCFLLHYFQRTFIFSFLINGGKPSPFFIFLAALVFCAVNGYLQVGYILHYTSYGDDWMSRPALYLGLALFSLGMYINIQSDSILRNLRKDGETGYKIPQGGMFEYVSGANFLGEMLEWCGFAVACGTIPAIAFAFFTCCNIGPRACKHHQFYLEKFEDYPKNRKAVIPFIL